jgi:hypothetical protein
MRRSSNRKTDRVDPLRSNLINKNAPKYDKKVKNIDGLSTEGSEVTYFISGRGLKKIVAKVYGETFRATTELYYSGEEPIFVFRRIERYDTQIGMTPPPKVIRVDETRLYRSGEKSIRIAFRQDPTQSRRR